MFKIKQNYNFLTSSECKKVVNYAKRSKKLERSLMLDMTSFENVISEKRTSNTLFCERGDCALLDVIDSSINQYMLINHKVVLPSSFVQITQYLPDHSFEAHTDSLPYDKLIESNMKQRLWTALIYLNNPTSGGETVFPNANLKITPEMGKIIAWPNTEMHSRHPWDMSLHSAEPIHEEDDEKFVMVKLYSEFSDSST